MVQVTTRSGAGLLCAVLAAVLLTAGPAAAEPDATPSRLAGPERSATAARVAVHALADRDAVPTALLARADDFPDALAAAALAGVLDAPILLTSRDALAPATAAALDDLGVERVLLLGGEGAIGAAVAEDLARTREVERLAGDDRFATAARIAAEAIAAAPAPPDTVVVVRGDGFADALAAGAPAFAEGWPILLTRTDALPAPVAAVLDDLRPARAIVLGGRAAVGDGVTAELSRRGIAVERVAGPTRTATATALADRLVASGWPAGEVILARGDDVADALAASVLAGSARAPILLAPSPRLLGPDTERWLAQRCPGVGRVTAVGGRAALGDPVLDDAHQARLACRRLPRTLDIRYRVESVGGADPRGLIDAVVGTLGDPRSWGIGEALRLRPTDTGADLVLRLAPSATVAAADPRCTAGRSCRVGDVLWIDDAQWRTAPAAWGGRLDAHRSHLVNHLVGHWLGVGATGCGSGPAPVMAEPGTCAPNPWPTAAERERVRLRHVPPVSIAFAGDVHGEGSVGNHLRAGLNPLDPIAPILRAADLAVVNLETAVGVTGSPEPGKQFTFRAPPELLPALRAAGVDVVSLANNHALDYGRGAMTETIQRARTAGLAPVGAGGSAAEAYAPAVLPVGRRTVAVVGLSRVLPPGWAAGPSSAGLASAYDVAAAERAVRAAAAQGDLVVVAIHWGVELAECPNAVQHDLARRLTAAGADVVAGHHPHILQGVQRIGGSLVHHSLGNFVWYHNRAPSRFTGVWTVELDGRGAVRDAFAPAEIDGVGRPLPVGGALGDRIRADVAARSPGGGRCAF
jgi:putative cell wall-binding protein